MFVLLPIKTDCPPRRRPLVNYALILVNVAIFLLLDYGLPLSGHALLSMQLQAMFALDGANPKLYQFVTYAFLHAGWAHIIGNMLFLYIFGNSLNDKLGHVEYLLFYLGGAIISGAGYALVSSASLVGASGAIAAVTTGFLILFPRSKILVVIWVFYFIDTFEISSLILIGFKMILWDNVLGPMLGPQSNVAHGAHLVGYAFGLVVPLILLGARALDRDQFDILALWSRIFRRREFAKVMQQGGPAIGGIRASRPMKAEIRGKEEPEMTELFPPKIAELRLGISESLERPDLHSAANFYRALIAEDPNQVLHRKAQLDVGNQLMSEQDYTVAAEAYEKYLTRYPVGEQIEQVQLLLGIIYSRYLPKPDRAKELFTQAKVRLKDPNQVRLCEDELRRLGG
jgi:membrane associated rhomboid family serine protease